MQVQQGGACELGWLADFYRRCGYGGSVAADDRVFYALEGDAVLGVVRLARENKTLVLRGMQVSADQRGRGVGAVLLRALVAQLGRETCFCLPYTHLEAFYAQGGFRLAADAELPAFILQRKAAYLERGMDVIAMLRE